MAAASVELIELRERMRKKLEKAWRDSPEAVEFAKLLKKVFTEEGKRIYTDCMKGKLPPGEAMGEIAYKCWMLESTTEVVCLYLAAKHLKLDEKFKKAWQGLPKELRNALLDIKDEWGDKEKREIKITFQMLNIKRLYKMCVRGKYEDVSSELKLASIPTTYSSCLSCVAEAKNLRKFLKTLWGTD